MLSPIQLNHLPEDFELRKVQEAMLHLLRGAIRDGNQHIIAHLATAGGKTVLAGMIYYLAFQKDPTCQVWFVVNRNTLLLQAKSEFEKFFGFDCSIVQGERVPDLSKHVQIATIQTLHNRLNSKKPHVRGFFTERKAKICVFDEAHLIFKGYQTVADIWNPLIIGLTATPFTKGMGRFWEEMVRPASMASLIKDKTLSDYKVMSCVPIDREALEVVSTGEFKDEDVERETKKIIGDVYQEWKDSDDMEDRPFIGFTKNIATAVALAELFQSNGESVAYVHSKMSDELVQDTLDAFKGGMYIGVFSVVKLIEGFDYPAVSALLDCVPLAESKHDPNIPNSCNRYVQKAGRGLRAHPGKDYTLIHDHGGNFERFGAYELIEDLFPVLDDGKPKKAPKKLTAKERLKRVEMECSKCKAFFKGSHCPFCGHKPKKPTTFVQAGDLEFTNGKMVEVKKTPKLSAPAERNRKESWDDKIRFAEELKGHCIQKSNNNPSLNTEGYYAHKYKARYGVWPNDSRVKYWHVDSREPGTTVSSWIKSQNIAYAKRKKA